MARMISIITLLGENDSKMMNIIVFLDGNDRLFIDTMARMIGIIAPLGNNDSAFIESLVIKFMVRMMSIK